LILLPDSKQEGIRMNMMNERTRERTLPRCAQKPEDLPLGSDEWKGCVTDFLKARVRRLGQQMGDGGSSEAQAIRSVLEGAAVHHLSDPSWMEGALAVPEAPSVTVLWCKALDKRDFDTMQLLATVTIAEGANVLGFGMRNRAIVQAPQSNTIKEYPQGEGKGLMDAAMRELMGSGRAGSFLKVLRQSKTAGSTLWRYFVEVTRTVRAPEQWQTSKALEALRERFAAPGALCNENGQTSQWT
jgi:hypothetical protein